MKKFLKWGGIIFLILIVIGAISGSGKSTSTQQNNSDSSNQQQAAEQPQAEPTAMTVEEVDAKTFIDAFDKNQLKAEEQYKDKRIKMTAYIQNISEDITGSPFLSLKPTNEEYYFGTTAKCTFKNKSDLTSVENGQQVTIEGTVTSQDLGIIGIKGCVISQ